MAFADQEAFRKTILDGPLFISPSLIESDQQFWLDDDEPLELGYGWAIGEAVGFDEGLHWQTEFETDRIIGPSEVWILIL